MPGSESKAVVVVHVVNDTCEGCWFWVTKCQLFNLHRQDCSQQSEPGAATSVVLVWACSLPHRHPASPPRRHRHPASPPPSQQRGRMHGHWRRRGRRRRRVHRQQHGLRWRKRGGGTPNAVGGGGVDDWEMASVEPGATSPIVSPSPSTMVSANGGASVVSDGDRLSSSRDEQTQQHWGSPPKILTQRRGHTQRATASSSAEARAAGQRQRHKHPGGRGEWSGIAEENGHRKR